MLYYNLLFEESFAMFAMALFVIASLLVCKGFFETQCNSGQRLQRFTFPKVVAERCKKPVNC